MRSTLAGIVAIAASLTATGGECAPAVRPSPAAAKPVLRPGAGRPASGPVTKRTSPRPPAVTPAGQVPVLESLEVWPPAVTLSGVRPERQVIVTGAFSDGQQRDLTDIAEYRSTLPSHVPVSRGGRIDALRDGLATVHVSVGAVAGAVRVTAARVSADAPVRFRADVEPVLTRAGCNQGACHAAMAGKGGFKLSLLGYDPDTDYGFIVRDAGRRRVMLAHPEQSLFLLKPLMAVPHAGGLRLKPGSYEYEVLAGWLADGAPGPQAGEPEVAELEVYPRERRVRLPAGDALTVTVAVPSPVRGEAPRRLKLPVTQRVAVLARMRDGSVEDVTRKAQFNPLNDGVATVDPEGRAAVTARGQAGVMVRYLGAAAVVRLAVPYRDPAQPQRSTASRGYIDELVAAKWREMGLAPSARCTDAELIRRVYLDVLGILPTPEEVRAFLASREPDKRAKLVESVLARPEYADYWTLKWGDLLRNHRDKLGDKGMWSFHNWLRTSFRANKPLDRLARELITAQGSTYTNGPANYYRVATNPADLAETTSQVFLGVRLACARCHHHPFEKWSQDDYWQMAAFFARVGNKGSDEFGIYGGEQVVRLNPGGEISNPRTGKRMLPTPLDGSPSDDPVDRRQVLAAWITAPENPFFARSVVNRYWAYLMGRGIVDPVDDLRVTNPPSNPELLDALARDFAGHGFDAKHLLRTILNSEVYQLSSHPTPENRPDEVFFTKYTVKRMGAEELLDAINFATGSQEKFASLPLGFRAVQLPDPGVQSYFLEVFGRPARMVACECERSVEPNMAQALHLMNSDFVQNKIASGSGRIARLMEAKKSDDEIIDELCLVTFSRFPTDAERQKARALVAEAGMNKKEGFEDLLWVLLNSREFLFKH